MYELLNVLTILFGHAGEFVDLRHIRVLRYHVDVLLLDKLSQLGLLISIVSITLCFLFLLFFGLRGLASFSLRVSLSSRLALSLCLAHVLGFNLLLLLLNFFFFGFLFFTLCRGFRNSSTDDTTLLQMLMLVDIKALYVLRTSECHSHLAFLFILVRILLFHLANFGVLATLDFALVHYLVVILLILLLLSLFATFTAFLCGNFALVLLHLFLIVLLLLLLLLVTAFLLLLLLLVVRLLFGIFTSFFANLNDGVCFFNT